ncbi:MAG: 3-oxoacyl-[acyl-carrier-protein] reductase [Spirochaetae bacterium HGW-Spirochaetae-3]|jgi:3-oxoacyl-[acyl-carrier protein] reductase|nr:MAG: 3-oxoacyl-[acyl-carrier-protein] reductase [Spirochaetae bacterium HGW-Spirochaetae-3]
MGSALLDGKNCVVTGGSKGIGLAIVEAFVAEGASVEYFSRSRAAEHDAIAAAAAANGRELLWTACDVSDAAALEAAVEASIARGPIDVAVNNAGVTRDGLVFRMSLDDWRAVVDTNLTSAFIVSRAVARTMIKRRSGSVINVASVVGITGNGGQTNYAASKAGLIGFTKSLAKEVASRGVRVNAIAPGFIDTAMTEAIPAEAKARLLAQIPLGRAGSAAEVASVALFLASGMSSYVSGEVIKIDGGMAM